MTVADSQKALLGDRLVENGLISQEQRDRALADQKKLGGRIGYCIVRSGFLTCKALAEFFTTHPYAGRIQEGLAQRQRAAYSLPRALALYYKLAPIRLDGKDLTIALCEISHPNLIQTLGEVTRCRIIPMIVPESEIRSLLESCYPLPADPGIEFSMLDDHIFVVLDSRKNIKALNPGQLNESSKSSDRLRSIIAEAIHEKCRGIVIKPQSSRTAVFFKKETFNQIDFALTPEQHDDLVYLLLRLAKMNMLQTKTPQSGRLLLKVNDRKIVLAVAAIPTIYGIQLSLEMFDEKLLGHFFEEIVAAFPDTRQSVDHFFNNSLRGLYAITGPESSGRTMFLYSLIARSKEKFKNISTLESSIRYPIAGVHQKEVSDTVLEAALEEISNHPPELLACNSVKNARQVELIFLLAARIPVLAIFSSFDAFQLVDWLCSHNLKSPIKAGLLHTVVSTRVIPQICSYCSVPLEFDTQSFPPELKLSGVPLKMNQGCDHCRGQQGSGHKFIEAFRLDDEAIGWVLQDHSASFLRKQARTAGRKTLYDWISGDALQKQLDMLSVAKLQAAL
jgi:type IV pilus assembly protein PilB